jgi:hypothetical protein
MENVGCGEPFTAERAREVVVFALETWAGHLSVPAGATGVPRLDAGRLSGGPTPYSP